MSDLDTTCPSITGGHDGETLNVADVSPHLEDNESFEEKAFPAPLVGLKAKHRLEKYDYFLPPPCPAHEERALERWLSEMGPPAFQPQTWLLSLSTRMFTSSIRLVHI